MGPPIRVVVADNHSLFREGTRGILEAHPEVEVIGEAEDGAGAIEATLQLRPDVAVLDIRMGVPDGVEATRQIRKLAPGTAVLILTAYDDDQYVRAALEAGAAGYLLKTVRADELIDALRCVSKGETVLHSSVARKVAGFLSRKANKVDDIDSLTAKEREVLKLVCMGLRNKEIACNLDLSARTVESHLDSVFNKLGVRSRTEAAVIAAQHGWFGDNGRGDEP
jgi:two-component system, NarL family, response regulator LiaR